MIETTPVKSSSSLGAAERRLRSINGQARTLRSATQEAYGFVLLVRHPLYSWLLRHASFLWDHFQPHRRHGNKTTYERLFQRPYHYPLCDFASTVMALDPEQKTLGRAELCWQKGIWLGRSTTSSEHIVAMTVGIRRVRSIKVLPRDQWSLQDLQEMVRWPIWAQQPQAPPADMPRPLGMPGSFGGTKRSVNPQTARRFLKRFKEAKGATPRCAGCDPENRRQHKHHDHNKQCKRRQS